MNRRTAFYTDERTFWHHGGSYALNLPVGGWVQPPAAAGFAESPESKRRFRNLVDVSGLAAGLLVKSAPPAQLEDLLRVHPASYLKRLEKFSREGGGQFGIEAAVGPGSHEVARLSAGLAIAAVSAVLEGHVDNAYSLSRPPGHHCLPEEAMGFCLLANIPVAIEYAKAHYGLGKAVVVDWDVHHGNGTQHIYYARDDVLTISLHQENCFPIGYSGLEERGTGQGKGYNINIPLPAGAGHDTYIKAMQDIVVPAIEEFAPELVICACGFDANAVDPLARQQLHSDSYREMTRMLQQVADQHASGHLVMVHEGGYAESYVPFCGLAVLEELSGQRTEVTDPMLNEIIRQQPSAKVSAFHQQCVEDIKAYLKGSAA